MSDHHDDLDTTEDSRFTPANTAAVAVGLLAVMVLVAVLGYLAFDAEQDDVVADGPAATLPTGTTTVVPTDPEPASPVGADSPLVGWTEAQVRELYPLVRVVELDGEALPATMDLQPGRINLSVEDGTVVGATAEGCDEVSAQDPDWIQQACDPNPDTDGPDAAGQLVEGAAGALTLDVEGDQYYQGMAVVADPDRTRVLDAEGGPLDTEELQAGDAVWIWTTGGCEESSPVQCDLAAIVVRRAAG